MSIDDIDWFHSTNTDSYVRKHIWDDEVIGQELSETILKQVEELFAKNGWGLWKILCTTDDQAIGYVGLWTFFDEPQPQLLYALLPDYAGKGLATEASQKIIEYAFESLGFKYLVAATDDVNSASVSVCNRLGMKLLAEKEMDGKPTLFFSVGTVPESWDQN